MTMAKTCLQNFCNFLYQRLYDLFGTYFHSVTVIKLLFFDVNGCLSLSYPVKIFNRPLHDKALTVSEDVAHRGIELGSPFHCHSHMF